MSARRPPAPRGTAACSWKVSVDGSGHSIAKRRSRATPNWCQWSRSRPSSTTSASSIRTVVMGLAHERHPEQAAHRAGPAVAPDEVPGRERRPVGERDRDTVVLREPGDGAALLDRDPQLGEPGAQRFLDAELRDEQAPGPRAIRRRLDTGLHLVGDAGAIVDLDVAPQRHAGPAPGHQPLGQTQAVEHLQRTRLQPLFAREPREGAGAASTTRTRTPHCASTHASVSPVGPAPATRTSVSKSSMPSR